MQVVHPMQKCPAEFVGLFQEVLENTNWDIPWNIFICSRIVRYTINKGIILQIEVVQWISTVIDHHITFNRWLEERTGIKDISYTNQCRKAWLEWLVSPEGHYVHE